LHCAPSPSLPNIVRRQQDLQVWVSKEDGSWSIGEVELEAIAAELYFDRPALVG
jgi:hypothetical protein